MASACRLSGALLLFTTAFATGASAQTLTIPEIVVTPNYTPTDLSRIGSTVSVVPSERLERSSQASVAQVLRSVPGVTVIESGGPGGSSEVRLRGAETGHTVVLIDGVRVNDASSARGDFDFATLSLNDVERVEILKGPQSAVYGSDAMGGVVNIVTRKQAAKSSFSATVEAGSYGTLAERTAIGMRSGDFNLRFNAANYHSDGFSRRGNRDSDERDGSDKTSAGLRLSYTPDSGARVDLALNGVHQRSDYDSSGVSGGNAGNVVVRDQYSGSLKFAWPQTNDWLDQSATAFFSTNDKTNDEPTGSIPRAASMSRTVGAEYQAVADLAERGQLTLGARVEHEQARNRAETIASFPGYESELSTWAGYAEYQYSPTDRLHLTFSGRYDGIFADLPGFLTGRATAAYVVEETGTKLRGSVGSGAKRPTAYQKGNNAFAASLPGGEVVPTELKTEKSFGVDAGIEQTFFDGSIRVSATAFYNRFDKLLGFTFLNISDQTGYYENVDQSETKGVEFAADAEILPNVLSAGVTYTWMPTLNLTTGRPLARRPEHSGSFSVTFTPAQGFDATLSAVLVGNRLNSSSLSSMVPGYGRVDFATSVALSQQTKAFLRVENLFDARYKDPDGFNGPGLSAYVGLTWNR